MQTLNLFDRKFSDFNAFRVFDNQEPQNTERGRGLIEQLQTTLDIEKLLNIFAMEASKYIDFSGLYFQKSQLKFAMRGSKTGRQERQYKIKIGDDFVGLLSYSINKPISLTNHHIIKQLHQYLAHPLKNALQYHQVLQLAMEDPLSGLGNRRYFDEQIKRAISHANRQQSQLGLVVCDLNDFKTINDSYGHHIGDEVLIHFAKALQASVRDSDGVFRFGGDEFAILVENASDNSLIHIEERVISAVQRSPLLSKYQVTCSFGGAYLTRADDEFSLFTRADKALYINKQAKSTKLKLVAK